MNDLYNVIFEGNIKQGENPLEVKRNLAALFKVDIMRIEKIFFKSPVVIKREIPKEKALKYKRAIEHSGALCRIEKVVPQSDDKKNQVVASENNESPKVRPAPVPADSVMGTKNVQKEGVVAGQSDSHRSFLVSSTKDIKNRISQNISPIPKKTDSDISQDTRQNKTGINIMNRKTLESLGIGFAVFVIVILVPFLSYIFHYLITLVHELGHTIFGLIFGYFSVPAFDFVYGGGVTIHNQQSQLSLIFVYLFFGWLLYFFRKNRLTFAVVLIIVVLYSLVAFTSAHQLVILFMGHGAELIFAGIFLYRALSGSSIVVLAERPLYAFLAFFIFYKDFRFAYDLMYSPAYRAEYAAAKGGGHWMDFSRLAREFFHAELTSVAAFFLFLCVIVPVLTFLFFRYRPRLDKIFHRVLSPAF